MDVLRCLAKLLPQQQDLENMIPNSTKLLIIALLYMQCHILSTGEFNHEARSLFRHICQVRASVLKLNPVISGLTFEMHAVAVLTET